MNHGAFGIIGIGVFMAISGYVCESKILIAIGAFILLSGFGLLTVKPSNKDPSSGKEYMRCPNCGKYSGQEIPKSKKPAENGKTYKCMLCGYKW